MSFSFNIMGPAGGSVIARPKQFEVVTITWPGTSDPEILVQPLNFNELTITWAGTSSPSLNVS